MMAAATARIRSRVEELKNIAEDLLRYRDRTQKNFLAQFPKDDPAVLGNAGPPLEQNLKGKSIPELYDIAKNTEITAHGYYRQLRTLELARIQGVTLANAAAATKIAIPTHPALDMNAFRPQEITSLTDGKLDALQAEVDKVRAEVASMIAAEQRMLDMIRGIMGEDVGGTVFGAGGGGVSLSGTFDGQGALFARRDDNFQGYTPADPRAFSHTWGLGVGPVTHKEEIFPLQKTMDLGKTLPSHGRKLVADATEKNVWMFVDSWYIIGPFPNPNREKIDFAFPPESSLDRGIDLDAVYIGWEGRPVQWQFRMSYTIPVVPHQPVDGAIWYAYSEVFAEKEQDRMCIFGSDDYGKAWMNGQFIFASGKVPHPWIPDRGYKKVHFLKGFNPILFKLENAWGRTGFSMCIYMGDM
jgi:hypothetical protein